MDPNTLDRLRSRNETYKYVFLVGFLLNPKLAERIRAVSSWCFPGSKKKLCFG